MARYHNILFILVLSYVVAALAFWHNSLQKQNKLMYQRDVLIHTLTENTKPNAAKKRAEIESKFHRKKMQFYGEGITFLLFILGGALLVRHSFKKRLQLTTQQNNFMLSITHELKTPIAGIKLGLETIRRKKLRPEQQEQIINNSLGDTERLNELCDNILLSTQFDGNQYTKDFEAFNLEELIKKCVEDCQQRHSNIRWEFNNYANLKDYRGDKFLWSMVINNLLENAYKYARTSKQIIVDAFESNNSVIIQVIDEGTGISDSEKKKIFQKFYRSGNESTRKSKGTGLGLYIVKRAIELHGGTVEMADNKPQGNIAIIQIPKST